DGLNLLREGECGGLLASGARAPDPVVGSEHAHAKAEPASGNEDVGCVRGIIVPCEEGAGLIRKRPETRAETGEQRAPRPGLGAGARHRVPLALALRRLFVSGPADVQAPGLEPVDDLEQLRARHGTPRITLAP